MFGFFIQQSKEWTNKLRKLGYYQTKIPSKTKKKVTKKGLKREKSQMWTERPLIQRNHKISLIDILREGMLQLGSLIWKGLLVTSIKMKSKVRKQKKVVWNQLFCWAGAWGRVLQPLQAKQWKRLCIVSPALTSVWCLIRSWHKFTNILCCWYSYLCTLLGVSSQRAWL